MKILIVNRFFGGAQIPTGRMAEDVARVFVEEGHDVVALVSSGEYAGTVAQALDQETKRQPEVGGLRPETGDRLHGNQLIKDKKTAEQGSEIGGQTSANGKATLHVETVCVPKWTPRALAWVWFTWQARKCIPKMDWDVCVLMTDPPLLPLLAARVKAAGVSVTRCFSGAETEGQPRDRTTQTPPHRATRRVAVWLMDLYPEALAASGRIGAGNPIYRWYFEKRQRALGSADLLICLGQAQKELLDTGRIRQTANSIRKEEGEGEGEVGASVGQCFSEAGKNEIPKYRTTEPLCGALTEKVRTAVVPPWDDRGNIALATGDSLKNLALYAGNLGEAHCFEEILAAAPHLPADWTIRFAARGAKLGALKEKASQSGHGIFSHRLTRINTDKVRAAAPTGLRGSAHAGGPPALAVSPPSEEAKSPGARVEITGYASEEETPGLLASARVHLITMSPGWEGIVVPSKLYGCIRTGRPVLFIGPENADTAREIRTHDLGKVLPPGASGEEVARAVLELAARETRVPQLKQGAGEIASLLVATAGLQDSGTTGPSGRAL